MSGAEDNFVAQHAGQMVVWRGRRLQFLLQAGGPTASDKELTEAR